MATSSDTHIEAVLNKIGRRVLEDVWISGRTRAFTATVAATLVGTAMIGRLNLTATANAATTASWISWVALALFALAASVSSLAVCLHRFRWCCVSAYIGGIATVVGVGMVWWHQTAPPGSSPGPSAWMVIGVLAATVLTLTWLGVILTPSERSQPDMRGHRQVVDRVWCCEDW